ncbi:unnamed protein product, partial [Effrenium voratum]
HDIRQRAKRKVVIARKKCQLELKKLRVEEANEAATAEAQEQEASMEEEVLREKLRQAEQALLQAEEQEEEQLKLVRASGEEELAQMASQLEEEAARKVGELGEAYRSQEELLAKREHQSSIAQSAAMNKAWRQRLEDAEAAAAKARAQLQVASEAESRLQCTQLQLELGESWPAGLSGSAGSSECLGDFSEVDAQADSFLRQAEWMGSPEPSAVHASAASSFDGGQPDLPLVYAAALEGIETHGWSAVYPADDPPAWTILHWAAMEGRLDVCHRLLAARADPMCEDERGWTPVDCANEAGEQEVAMRLRGPKLETMPAREAKEPLSVPPAIAATVAAVESYGWQAVHGGRREWTALHWAAAEGRHVLCERLLQQNADPAQVDEMGKSAMDYAQEAGHQSTWLLLWQAQQEHSSPSKRFLQQVPSPGPLAYPQSLLVPSQP